MDFVVVWVGVSVLIIWHLWAKARRQKRMETLRASSPLGLALDRVLGVHFHGKPQDIFFEKKPRKLFSRWRRWPN